MSSRLNLSFHKRKPLQSIQNKIQNTKITPYVSQKKVEIPKPVEERKEIEKKQKPKADSISESSEMIIMLSDDESEEENVVDDQSSERDTISIELASESHEQESEQQETDNVMEDEEVSIKIGQNSTDIGAQRSSASTESVTSSISLDVSESDDSTQDHSHKRLSSSCETEQETSSVESKKSTSFDSQLECNSSSSVEAANEIEVIEDTKECEKEESEQNKEEEDNNSDSDSESDMDIVSGNSSISDHSIDTATETESEDEDDDESFSISGSHNSTGSSFHPMKQSRSNASQQSTSSLSPLPLVNVDCSFGGSPIPEKLTSMSPASNFDDLECLSSPESGFTQQYSTGEMTAQMVALDEPMHTIDDQTEDIQATRAATETIPPIATASKILRKLSLSQMRDLASPMVYQSQCLQSPSSRSSMISPISPLPKHLLEDKGPQSYMLTPPKIAMAKADDTDSEDSGDEDNIPLWAQKENLKIQVRKQHQRNPDPTKIFPIPRTCNLEKMFAHIGSSGSAIRKRPRQRNLKQRGSSGNWSRDRVTTDEEESFRKKMRYH